MHQIQLWSNKHAALEPILGTIVSYNASAVKMYDATSSLVRLEKQKYFLLLYKRS
jgi:hypothetical protein